MIRREMKYNLHYVDVRGDVLPPPHCTNTSCSVAKLNVKKIAFGNKEQTTDSKVFNKGTLQKSMGCKYCGVQITQWDAKCFNIFFILELNSEFMVFKLRDQKPLFKGLF